MNEVITVIKRNEKGSDVFQYQGKILRATTKGFLIRAIFKLNKSITKDITFLPGDMFEEYYIFHKWFNIYQVHSGDSEQIKAWYCNICRPIFFQDSSIIFDDLVLDLLIDAEGRQHILDRDEFRAIHLSLRERMLALKGLIELRSLFRKDIPGHLSALLE